VLQYFSLIHNQQIALFFCEVLNFEDKVYYCKSAYGVIQFSATNYEQKVKSADNRDWILRSEFETEVETVVQGMEFNLSNCDS
jgi:hypothetical protein